MPSQALIHGLNRHYYSIGINYRKNELEERMLLNLHKKTWMDGLTLKAFEQHNKANIKVVQVGEAKPNADTYSRTLAISYQTRWLGTRVHHSVVLCAGNG